MTARRGPLADVRVVAIEQYGAGPYGTMQLADLGADVIKVEDPSVGGDVSRYVPPYRTGTDSLFFESFNRNKRSLTLDLRQPTAPRRPRGPRPRLGRGRLEPARRPAGEAPDPVRRPRARQPADRLRLALGLRDDRPTGGRGRLRLHRAGDCRLDAAHRRPRPAAHEERALARRLLRRLRRRARDPRGRLAGAARRPRLRRRPLAVRDGARAAHVHRRLGRVARVRAASPGRLGASDDGAVPGVPDGGRLDHGRLPEAAALGALLRRDRAAGARDATRASPTSPRATATATCSCRCSPVCSAGARQRSGSSSSPPTAFRADRSTTSEPPSRDPQAEARGDVVAYDHPALGEVRGPGVPVPARRRAAAGRTRADARRAHARGPARPVRLRRRAASPS